MRTRMAGVLAAAAALWLAAPAAGDWLVTRDGARVETRGPWKVQGRQVIFTRPNGTLSALRLEEVDLEASDRATADSRAPKSPPPAEAPARQPVLVLTNDDIPTRVDSPEPPSAVDPEAPAGDGGTAPEAAADAPPEVGEMVELISWNAEPSSEVDGLEIVGVVRNRGEGIAANVTVAVTVVDEDGAPLLETNAFLRSTGIGPGQSTTFRALLPGIVRLIADPVFDVRSLEVSGTAPAAPAGEEGAAEAGAEERPDGAEPGGEDAGSPAAGEGAVELPPASDDVLPAGR